MSDCDLMVSYPAGQVAGPARVRPSGLMAARAHRPGLSRRLGVPAGPLVAVAGRPGESVIRQVSLPVLSTFCSSVLALFTVAVKLAPCIKDFIMSGMIWSVASAAVQFFELSGEIWV